MDKDQMLLVQETKTGACALAFSGTDNPSELYTSLKSYGTGYCGFTDVHAGYRNELWTLTNQPAYRKGILPKLARCSKTICVGHSLGGALCEIFVGCANSGNFS